MGTPSHLGHMDRVAATMPSQAHAGAAQEAPDIGQWEGQDVPLVRSSSCDVKGGIPSSRRDLPTYLPVDGALGVMVEVPAENRQRPFLRARVDGEYGVVLGRDEELQVVLQARVYVGGHARLVEYPVWACVTGPLCGLEVECGDLAHLWQVVVAHAVKDEGSVSGVGLFNFVSYGVFGKRGHSKPCKQHHVQGLAESSGLACHVASTRGGQWFGSVYEFLNTLAKHCCSPVRRSQAALQYLNFDYNPPTALKR